MFTGLVEHIGTVSFIQAKDEGCTLSVAEAGPVLGDCHVNDSIAVNGVCLTVIKFSASEGWFQVWVANETLKRSNLGELDVGSHVHLERAMKADARFGGHFVQGHVDASARILAQTPDGESLHLLFQLPEPTPEQPSLLPYIVRKGSITIDGVSLTITSVDDPQRTFGVMLIKHTQTHTTLAKKPIGSKVNVEVDMVGKYIEKSIPAALEGRGWGRIAELVEKKVLEVLAKKERNL